MLNNFMITMGDYFNQNILGYLKDLYTYPVKLIALILDIIIVTFLIIKLIQIVKNTRAWQLLKGIILLIIVTALSSLLNLKLLNFLITSLMTYGVALIVIFQPEIRRALEQLGTNKFTQIFGMDKDLAARTKEDIYKIVIAASELSKMKTGALIVFERDIKIKDIINTGIPMNSEISPQVLVNLFTPNTPLHDGAVIISENKIAAAACMLPLASDKDIAKELGTRHRAGIGISKESDGIAIIVSEETGKISVAKDGTLIADLKEDALRKILLQNIVVKRFKEESKMSRIQKIKEKMAKKNNQGE